MYTDQKKRMQCSMYNLVHNGKNKQEDEGKEIKMTMRKFKVK